MLGVPSSIQRLTPCQCGTIPMAYAELNGLYDCVSTTIVACKHRPRMLASNNCGCPASLVPKRAVAGTGFASSSSLHGLMMVMQALHTLKVFQRQQLLVSCHTTFETRQMAPCHLRAAAVLQHPACSTFAGHCPVLSEHSYRLK